MQAQEFDDINNPDVRGKFFREGKVIFLLNSREAAFLKNLTQHDLKLGMITRRPELKYRIYSKYLVLLGILKVLFLPIYSHKVAEI